MRLSTLLTVLLLLVLVFGLGFALAFSASAQRPPAPQAQLGTDAWSNLPTLTLTPAAWQIKAAGDALATEAAAAYTAVAERTRLESERQATSTAQRVATEEAAQITEAAPTVVARQIEMDAARTNATREAKLAITADALAAQRAADAATQEAGATATNAAMLATEDARRAQNETSARFAAGLAGAGMDAAKAVALMALVGVLVYVVRKFLPVALTGLEVRARLIQSGPAPMAGVTGPDGRLYLVLISNRIPTEPAHQVIDQPTANATAEATPPAAAQTATTTERFPGVPMRLAVHDDNPARPALWRVLNLLATAIEVAGNEGRAIPRYDKINFDSNARQELTHALDEAGHVTISNAGTQLTGNETLYSLYCGLSNGRLNLDPVTTPSTALEAITAQAV